MNKKLFLALPLLMMLLVGCSARSAESEENTSKDSTTSQTTDSSSKEGSSSGGETSEQSSETSEQSSESSEESSDSSSEETPTGVAYSIKVGETSYSLTKQTGDLLDGQTGQYECTIASVTKNAAVAFYGDNALISENIGSDAENEDNKNLVQDGVIHNGATNVSVYFKTWNNGGYSFWLTGYVADEVIPEGTVYSIEIGPATYELEKNDSATLLDTQTGQYEATITSVSKDDAVSFYADNVLIDSNIGSDEEDTENKNLVQDNKIHNDATNVSVYFKTWEDGGYSFWLTGYVADETPQDTYVNYMMYRTTGDWAKVELTLNPFNNEEYYIQDFALEAESEVVFHVQEKWFHYADLKDSSEGSFEQSPAYLHENGETYSDDNIIVKLAGKYEIWLNFNNEQNKKNNIYMRRDSSGDPVTNLVIYFSKPTSWANTVNAYCWTGGASNASWPGMPMARLGTTYLDGGDIYSITVESTYAMIIFNDANGKQTADISLSSIETNTIFWYEGNNLVHSPYSA